MKKHALTTLIVLVISGLLMVACQPSSSDTAPTKPETDAQEPAATPNEPSPEVPTEIFDPAMGISADNTGLVYETLLNVQDGELIPMLALNTTVSDDGLDYILTLRSGVTFHDGSLLNADSVIANFDRWFDPASGVDAWASSFGGFKGEVDSDGKPLSVYDGIEKVDELTVLVHLNKPDADFLNKLSDSVFAIVSPDALAASNFGYESGVDGGTGPYMIGAWNTDGLTLEPYTSYWDSEKIPDSSMDVMFK